MDRDHTPLADRTQARTNSTFLEKSHYSLPQRMNTEKEGGKYSVAACVSPHCLLWGCHRSAVCTSKKGPKIIWLRPGTVLVPVNISNIHGVNE